MKLLLTALALLVTALPTGPQGGPGTLTGRVTRPGTTEGIAGVQITLLGPFQGSSGGYALNPALTDSMRAQVEQLIATAPPGVTPDVVANAVARLEAQLLGLTPPPPPGVAATPPQNIATTDNDGQFTFRNLAPGQYQVRAQKEGYFGVPLPGAIAAPTLASASASVTDGQPSPPVAIQMLRGATVSGRVRDPNGQPVSNLQVTAQQWSYRDGRPALAQLNSKATDDRGEFRLFWLPPGDYLIAANPPRPTIAPRPTDAFARTWFPNAPDPRYAPRISVSEGAEIAGIDIAIGPQSPVSVSGRIVSSLTGPNGQPSVPQPTLYVVPRDPNALLDTLAPTYPNLSPNRTSGEFEIRGVAPGSYDLVAIAPGSNGRPFPGRTPIDVGSGNLNNVTINIHPGVEVRSRLYVDGNPVVASAVPAPPPPVRPDLPAGVVLTPPPPPPPAAMVPGAVGQGIRIQLRSRETYPAPFDSAVNSNQTTDASGDFIFGSVPEGHYTVMVSGLPANAYVADIRAAGASIFDSGLRVTTDPPGMLEVLVSTKGGTLEGTAANALQQPAEGATVVLVPVASRRGNQALYRTARALAQGTFRLTAIPPGEYKLFAWESIPPTAYMNAEYLAPFENRGVAVTVAAGQNQVPTIPVISNDRR